MKKLVTIDKDYNIKLNSQIKEFINPDLVFVPFSNPKINLKLNQKILKDEEIFENVYAPISGNVKGVMNCLNSKGNTIKCLAIENDFEEHLVKHVGSRRKISNLTIEEFLSLIKEENLKDSFSKNFKRVVVSGIDDEPYVANATFIQKKYPKEILEMLEAIYIIFHKPEITIVIKNTDREAIDAYENYFGTYQEINLKMVDDLFLIGKKDFLLPSLNLNNQDTLYLTIFDIYNLWLEIKKNRQRTEKIITISGDAILNPQVVLVKIGTKLETIIKNLIQFKEGKYQAFINGFMQGIEITDFSNYIIDENTDSVIIMHLEKVKSKKCIACGACLDICPVSKNPMNAYLTNKKISCLNCGLCTYICPVYINLKKYVGSKKYE